MTGIHTSNAVRCTQFPKMILIVLISQFLGNVVADACGECQCSVDFKLMACSGDDVFNYPELAPADKKLITKIEIINSLMLSLPIMDQKDYPSLTLAIIERNIYLRCTYADQWTEALRGQGSVVTDCPPVTEPGQNFTIIYTSVSTPYSEEHSTADISEEQWTLVSTECSSTTPATQNIVVLTVFSLLCLASVMTGVIFITRSIKKYRRRVRLPGRITNNSIYQMTTMDFVAQSEV